MSESVTAVDAVLAVAVLGTGAFAVFARSRLPAAAMFLVFGATLAMVWARLQAPDVAIAEAVLGAGVTGALLMIAVTSGPDRDGEPVPARRLRAAQAVLWAALAAVPAAAVAIAVRSWQPDVGLGPAVQEALPASGVEHEVTAVLLNFRSYDTLLEVAVLAAAAFGAVALWSDADRPVRVLASGQPQTMVRVLVPVLVLMGGWMLVAGSTRPGGAFQAGALLAGALALLYFAGPALAWRRAWLIPALTAGLAGFLLLALIGAVLTGTWLELDPRWAGGAILAVETVVTLSIAASLAVLLIVLDHARSAAGVSMDGVGSGGVGIEGVDR